MIFSGFSLAKLLSGFALWRGQNLGKFIYTVVIMLLIAGGFYAIFLKKSNVEVQKADVITNVEIKESSDGRGYLLELKLGPVKFGLF